MIVVGGGPVGLTLAMDLRSRGVDVVVAEIRGPAEAPEVKCNHVSARSMEIFRRLGVADAVRAAGLPDDHPHDVAFRTTFTGPEMARITIPGRAERRRGVVRGPDGSWATPEPPHRVNQMYLEPVLYHHAVASGVRVLNRCRVDDLGPDDQGVTATAERLDSGRPLRLRGSFLVGCDGGRSAVRHRIGVSFEGDELLTRNQSSLIRAPDLLARAGHVPAWGTIALNQRRSGTIYAIDGTSTFLVHNYLRPDETDFDAVDRDRSIRTILGVDDGFRYELISRQDWFGRRLIAQRFRQGRVFLCGDAAHIWVPYGGYGMNAGIADAAGLAWLLAAHVAGWAPEAALDAYDVERRPITDQVSRHAMSHARAQIANRAAVPDGLEDDGPEGAAVRDAYGALLVELNTEQYCCAGLNFGSYLQGSPLVVGDGEEPPGYTMGTATPSTVPGCRLPHIWLADGSSLYDRLGLWYTLLHRDPEHAGPIGGTSEGDDGGPAGLRATAAAQGLPLAELSVAGQPPIPGMAHRYLLVRPDQHVAWRGDRLPADPASLVATLRGAG